MVSGGVDDRALEAALVGNSGVFGILPVEIADGSAVQWYQSVVTRRGVSRGRRESMSGQTAADLPPAGNLVRAPQRGSAWVSLQ